MTVDDASVYFLNQYFRVCHTFAYLVYDAFVTDGISIRHIIAQADVTPLHCCVQFGQFTDNLIVKVIDAAVVKTKLLDALGRTPKTFSKISPVLRRIQR